MEVDPQEVRQGAGSERDPAEGPLRQQKEALRSFQDLEAVPVEFHDQR